MPDEPIQWDDRVDREKELQDAKQMYQQILDAITDLILVKCPQSRIVWANKAFREYYQMENSELIGIVDTANLKKYESQKLLAVEEVRSPVISNPGKKPLYSWRGGEGEKLACEFKKGVSNPDLV